MINKLSRTKLKNKRHLRSRRRVLGTKDRPRVSVFRSRSHLYLQLVDDTEGCTLCSLSTLTREFREKKLRSSKNMDAAGVLAEMFAQRLKEKNISSVVFDRSGYRYHGKVRVMAETLRGHGLLS